MAIYRTREHIFFVFAALVELFGGFLYSLAWYIILKPSGVNVSIKQAYFITMGSLFLIYTTPSGITAEAARIAMTKNMLRAITEVLQLLWLFTV
ncbi:hypothetical protein B9P99_05800 [Candidatus Marsarchaeota G1 archaeon OSP_B]|uniref:Uncharacterized protein n=1 Tax=Candidatus Marsarchaeota G1 archaeon OSP_B TaxID=1978153 RepID=A0A2R6AQL0_9ARCH|nr:MAG: hypothetical protein B9P99_05800 [Candidatus Marsarchaeota G1 archaeon OSP_B]